MKVVSASMHRTSVWIPLIGSVLLLWGNQGAAMHKILDDDVSPERYDSNKVISTTFPNLPWDVPIVRLDEVDEERLWESIRSACEESGFFYLEGHGISQETFDLVLDTARLFFDWSVEEKEKAGHEMAQYNRSAYISTRKENLSLLGVSQENQPDRPTDPQPDHKETFSFTRQAVRNAQGQEHAAGALEESKMMSRVLSKNSTTTSSTAWLEVRDVMADYFDQVSDVAHKLVSAMGQHVLRLNHMNDDDESIINAQFLSDLSEAMRFNYYPNDDSKSDDNHLACGDHSDFGLFTLLLTDDHKGLQAYVDGSWREVPPKRGAFIVNVADMMERLTNGHVKAARHRVIMSGDDTKGDRYSVPMFVGPKRDSTIEPLPYFRSQPEEDGEPWQYPSVVYQDYIIEKFGDCSPTKKLNERCLIKID